VGTNANINAIADFVTGYALVTRSARCCE